MGIIDQLRKRELDPEHIEAFYNEQCVTSELVDQLRHSFTLHGHTGCVNTIRWNAPGTLLASGSDDQHILVWREDGRLLRRLPTAHTNNIFSLLFVPHARDHLIVSAAGDCQVLLHDLESSEGTDGEHRHIQRWECGGRVKKVVACAAEPRLFWSASEDGMLRQYDLRDNCAFDLLDLTKERQMKSLATNEARAEMIAVGVNDAVVPVYDRRNMKEPVIRLLPAHHNFGGGGGGRFLATHLAFNQRGDELIVNIGSDNIYIFDVRDQHRHSSPDVLASLKGLFLDDEWSRNASISKASDRNGTVPSSSSFVLSDITHLKDAKEFSNAIEKCSKTLFTYWGNALESISAGQRTPDQDQKASQTLEHSETLIQCLTTRAFCYLERGWEGDQLDAIRDSVTVLRISRKNRLAHSILIKSLMAQKQIPLARECYAHFCAIHTLDEQMLELGRQISDENKDEAESNLWTSEHSERYRDYVDRFTGHLNINTDIKESNWFGADDSYIVAGSDCGSMFIWERSTQNVVRVFKADHYTVNCCQPHPQRCLIASSGIDDVVRFWEPASTFLKTTIENRFPEETDEEDRDITEQRFELMIRNRRARTPELVWEQLLNSVGLGLFRVDPTHEADETEADRGEENEEEEEAEGTHVIRCRQM